VLADAVTRVLADADADVLADGVVCVHTDADAGVVVDAAADILASISSMSVAT
jgi:hypothetical protein